MLTVVHPVKKNGFMNIMTGTLTVFIADAIRITVVRGYIVVDLKKER